MLNILVISLGGTVRDKLHFFLTVEDCDVFFLINSDFSPGSVTMTRMHGKPLKHNMCYHKKHHKISTGYKDYE